MDDVIVCPCKLYITIFKVFSSAFLRSTTHARLFQYLLPFFRALFTSHEAIEDDPVEGAEALKKVLVYIFTLTRLFSAIIYS